MTDRKCSSAQRGRVSPEVFANDACEGSSGRRETTWTRVRAICIFTLSEPLKIYAQTVGRRLRDAAHYHFVTEWHARATPDEVIRILADPLRLPEWWPAVYLHTQVLAVGDDDGVGQEVLLVTKGWLPYTLRWRLRVASKQNASVLIVADGDLVGSGRWTLAQAEDRICVRYEWMVAARKPSLRYLSPILRQVFILNHIWAMQRGEESLMLELERRRPPGESRYSVPPPPPATPRHAGAWLLHLLTHASWRPFLERIAWPRGTVLGRDRGPSRGPSYVSVAPSAPNASSANA